MADTKITALTALTAADPINDVIPIVDVSDTSMAASGTTKKISVNNILGASGTATLASATITGALTAGTTTLVAHAAGYTGKVGIGTATPSETLEVKGTANFYNTSGTYVGFKYNVTQVGYIGTANAFITSGATTNFGIQAQASLVLATGVGAVERYNIDSTGISTWSVAGTTAMTLNSTGLGVGASPSYQLHVAKSQASQTAIYVDNQQNNAAASSALTLSAYGGFWNLSVPHSATFVNPLIFKFGSTPMMTLDASGNLLVGKTATGFGTVGNEVKANGEVFSTQASTSNVASTYHVYSTGAAAYRFYVGMAGTVFATNTTISAISDARLKENVQDIDVGLGAILALKPRKFDWKAGKGKDIKGDRGFIAQEFEQVFPQLVDEWADPAPEGEAPYKSVRQDLIPVLVKAIQELTARVQTLETR